MATLSPAQIYALARNAGLSPSAATTATAIALAESGGRTDVPGDIGLEDSTWGPSVGLWQVRSQWAQQGSGQVRDQTRLTDPKFNASSMAAISSGGKNFSAWTTYKNGTYKKFLPQVSKSVQQSGGDNQSTLSAALSGIGLALGAPFGMSASGATEGAVTGQEVSSWSGAAMILGLKILGAAAAAGLVIVGAVHTVSDK